MSSIALSGNAAGAGVFTIASPNSASSYTATLPTATGTLALTSNIVQVQPISASIATNAITVSASALTLDFRSTTLTSGTVTTVSGTPSSLTIAATDSFGLVTAYGNQRIAILAINNAGTIELAASALYGGVSLDETGVITTAATSTTATAIKAANVRTGVAYRVIGFIDATFTTATGWGSLVLVQGQGGEALNSMSSLGYSQTWQNVAGSRALGTTYYNTTGRPIQIALSAQMAAGNRSDFLINGTTIEFIQVNGSVSIGCHWAIIPPGASYSSTSTNVTLNTWFELR
jgi:hypothetical protein